MSEMLTTEIMGRYTVVIVSDKVHGLTIEVSGCKGRRTRLFLSRK